MPEYCAFLGHQPHISLAELAVLMPDFSPKKQWDARIVTFETAQVITQEKMRLLGGTVLIAEKLPLPPSAAGKRSIPLEDVIPKMLYQELKKTSKGDTRGAKRKVTFSFRCLNVQRSAIRSLYRICKQFLRERELPSRYIGNERHPAKPGTLLLRGIPGPRSAEIVILQDRDRKHTWVGATCAVQDIEEYTARDMGKPFRDTRTGLLPPKLAQIMLNLATMTFPKDLRSKLEDAGNWEGVTVWDPFCGSGVILMETLLRRAHTIGSDRMERAIKGCRQNMRWLRLREKTPKAIAHEVFKQNATKSCTLPKNPTVIVTETSLGPGLSKPPTKQEVAKLLREAEALESAFFQNIAALLPDVPIVCTFPVYITRDGVKHQLTKSLKMIDKLGYRLTGVHTPFHKKNDRMSLVYLRPDQHVGREIFCFLPPGEGNVPVQKEKKRVGAKKK